MGFIELGEKLSRGKLNEDMAAFGLFAILISVLSILIMLSRHKR